LQEGYVTDKELYPISGVTVISNCGDPLFELTICPINPYTAFGHTSTIKTGGASNLVISDVK
jgi:hypothetical protein